MTLKANPPAPLSTVQNTLWNAAGCVFYLGCQWLTTVLVVRISQDYSASGNLAFAMAVGIIFASIALYKIRTFQVSDLHGEYSESEYVTFRLATILLGFCVCAVYLPLTSQCSMSLIIPSAAYLLFKADESFSDVIYGIYQQNGRMDFIGISQFARGVLSLGCFSVGLYLTKNLTCAILFMTFGCFLVTCLYDLRHVRLFADVKPRLVTTPLKGLAKTCFTAMVASLLANSIVSVVRQYFGIEFGSEQLGYYASVATPAVLIQVAASYLYSPLIGTLAKKLEEGRTAFLRSFAETLILLLVVVGVFIGLLSFFGNTLLALAFGQSIADYAYLFPYVLIATASIGVLFYVNDVLIIKRCMRWMLASNALALVCALVAAVALTHTIGMNGINFSIVIGAVAGIVFGMVAVLKR